MNTCSACNGTGNMPCPHCGGTGINPIPDPELAPSAELNLERGGETCVRCTGTGETVCSRCNGTGMEPGRQGQVIS